MHTYCTLGCTHLQSGGDLQFRVMPQLGDQRFYSKNAWPKDCSAEEKDNFRFKTALPAVQLTENSVLPNVSKLFELNPELQSVITQSGRDVFCARGNLLQQNARSCALDNIIPTSMLCVLHSPTMTRAELTTFFENAYHPRSNEFVELISKDAKALDFLYTRHEFVMSSPAALYWFTFWDDFWQNNSDVKQLQN
jgi:hypothetical protein